MALRESAEKMRGYQFQFFFLMLLFFVMIALSFLTLGIGFLFVYPICEIALSRFFLEVNGELDTPAEQEEENFPLSAKEVFTKDVSTQEEAQGANSSKPEIEDLNDFSNMN